MAVLRDLRLSFLVAALVAGGAAVALALSGRAPHLAPDAVQAAVQARLPERVHTVVRAPGGVAPWGPGDPVQVWLTAGEPADLFHAPARQVGDAISLLGAPRRSRATPLVAEQILLTRRDQALVALRDGATTQVIALHAPEPMALYLAEPTRLARADWTGAGFSVVTDAGPITVDVAQGAVSPAAAGQWLSYAAAPAAPVMDGVGEAPEPVRHTWTPGETITRDGVKLTAYDTRTVALTYVPSVVRPGGVHGRPDHGPPPPGALAWLPAPALGGAAVDGTVRAPLLRGGMAIAIDTAGRARVGAFAGEPDTPRDGRMRQVGAPLVLDGRPVRVTPDAPGPQHGLGVTDAGWLIIARAPTTTRFALASALAGAGVVQGIALGPAVDAPTPEADGFAVVPRPGLRAQRWQAAGWTPKDLRLAIRRAGDVEIALIETEATQVQVVPGSAEVGGAGEVDLNVGWCLTGGVRSDRAPYGLKLGAETRRTPREGVLGLMIDAQGRARLGLAPAQVAEDVSVLQGPQLIRDGRAAIEDRRVEPGVLTAIGGRVDGRLVYAQTSAGVGALVDALLAAQVVDAIRLGDVSASDAGRVVPAAELGATQGTALLLTPTPPPPAVLPARAIRAW